MTESINPRTETAQKRCFTFTTEERGSVNQLKTALPKQSIGMVDTSFVKKWSIWLLNPVLGESFPLSEENKLLKWNKVTWLPDKAAHMQPEHSKQLRVCASVCLQWTKSNLHETQILQRFCVGTFKDKSSARSGCLMQPTLVIQWWWWWGGVGLCLESDWKPKDTLQNKNRLNTHTLAITHFLRLIYLSVCS